VPRDDFFFSFISLREKVNI